MASLNRAVKIGIASSLLSLFVYICYILRGSYVILFGYLANSSTDVNYVSFVGLAFWTSTVGITARFIGVIVGLTAVFLLWIKNWRFVRIKNFAAAALLLESVSFIGLIPSLWLLLNPASRIFTPSLGYGYLIQILFTVPLLLALAYEVAKSTESSEKSRLLKVGAVAFVGYTVALVTNEVSRWVSMLSLESLQFIEGIRAVGLVNAIVLMPFAIVFAIVGALRLFQQKNRSAMRWLGASLLIVGLNYTIYLVFAFLINALNTLPVVDIWTIPLLALGIALLLNSRDPSIRN